MLLDYENIQLIRDKQQDSIHAKTLVNDQLDLIYTNKWFNIWVPKVYNGLELPFDQGLKLLEELAYYDGGLAWTVTLCSGANMFVGFIEPQMAKTVFSNPKVCFGGSGRANGKAIWTGEHYIISGKWSFATGAPHLTDFTLNVPIYDGEQARLNEEGNPVVLSFFVPREQVLIHYDWDTFGLECTASHSFSLENAIVKKERAFVLSPDLRRFDSPLYRIPFMPFAELTLLVNYLGMYRRFLDLAEKQFFEKSKDTNWSMQYSKGRFRIVDQLQQELKEFNLFVDITAKKIWESVQRKEISWDDTYLTEITHKSRGIAKSIRMHAAEIVPLLGIQAAQREEEINIVFRNLFTASQHSLLNVR